jgi:carbamoyl-phosphate synthase large subunit
MRILVTSVGQRGYLLDYFRQSLSGAGEILAADATPFAPAFHHADAAFVLPPVTDSRYDAALVGLCRDERIDGVLSINDLELPTLAALAPRLAQVGATAVVSSPEVVEMCFDKYATARALAARGIAVPLSLSDEEVLTRGDELTLPVIAKPRRGSRSQGISIFTDRDAIAADARASCASGLPADRRRLYQEFIDSDQFSLHVFNDADGRPLRVVGMVNLVPHMSGETFHLETVAEPALLDLGWRIGHAVGHVGPLCADIHHNGEEFVVLELNPRFGGGYPVSHFAGADFTGLVASLVAGKRLTPDEGLGFEPGVVALKQFIAHATTRADIQRSVRLVNG